MMAQNILSSITACSMILLTMAWDFGIHNKTTNHSVMRRDATTDYRNIVTFWQKHKNEFVLHGEHEEVVLVMGNTGAGKTTIVSALVGRKLKAIKLNGYLVIVDEEDRIGTNSASKTLIPEAMIDKKNNVTYIDCSGFRDNRDVEYEISSIYFQNILMDQVKKIKLILIINHDSLINNGNKNDFDDLFEHIGEFIKDIPKFYDGMALVVTKVENSYEQFDNGTILLNNDNQLDLEGIAKYLEDKREVYRHKTESIEKYRVFVNLITALLQKKNNLYTKIAIFRKPTRQGLLENLSTTKDEINIISKMIRENLHFVEKKKDDFGFALSKASKKTVDNIVTDIFRDALTNRLYKMGNETLTYYFQIEKQYSDVVILHKQVLRAFDAISKIKNVDGPLELFQEFLNAANDLNISVSLTNLNIISEDIKTLKFFTMVSDSNGDTNMMLLKNGMQNVIESIENLKNFYDFLNNLQKNLASYNTQKLKNDYRIKNIMRSCVSLKYKAVQNIMDLENIVQEISSDKIYKKIKTLILNQFQLNHLTSVFGVFSSQLEFSCPSLSEPMIIKGYNVRMSDVVTIRCWEQAKNIQIFALNKVFIDCTINKTGAEAQLFIFGPTWEVVGGSKIILDGKAGEPHDSTHAQSSYFKSENGVNGLPGHPGGPAGNFYGVGKEFINSEYLEIQANGGTGGPGQHGGNGADGIAGEELPDLFFKINQDSKDVEHYFKDHRYKYNFFSLDSIHDVANADGPTQYKYHYNADVSGKPATKPTNGGNGGVGGKGGYPGRIIINGLGKLVNIKTSNNPGSVGVMGQGGRGGKNTTEGRRVKFKYSYGSYFFNIAPTAEYTEIEWKDGAIVPAGKDGKPGINTNGEKLPLTTVMMSPYLAITSFKDFLRINIFENVKESELRNFIHEIDDNNQIKAQYNTLAFVKEFKELENRFFELTNKIDFVPFYNSFLTRIEEFVMSEKNLESKKILNYIYTAALTKMFTLKKKRKGKTVVNLSQYLNTIETSVKEIREAQHLQIVQNYRNDYRNILHNKIREANDFIQNKIEPEINNLWDKTDKQIKTIVDEIKNNENSIDDAITSLEKNRAKIRDMMHLRSILLPLKLSSSTLSFLGPIGAGVGAAVTSSVTVAEGMLLDTISSQGQNKILSLDPNLKLMSRVTEVFNNKPKQLAEKLTEVVAQLEKYKDELSTTQQEKIEISQRIGDLKTQINEVEKRKVSRISDIDRRDKDVKRIENEINEFINSRKDILEKEKKQLDEMKSEEKNAGKLKKEKKIEKSLRRINDVQSVLNSVEVVFNVLKKLENDEGMIKNINNQISEYVDQLKDLEKLEGQVYDIVIPDLRQVEETLNAIRTSVNGSSHAKLDLTKWTVRTTLRNLKSLLQKFTHKMTFELQCDITRYMEQIDEAFSILIDIYDRIDSYSDSVRQAEYIAHIMSTPMINVQVTDSELNNALINLKLVIQSNILFEKYGIALHAFKQHYFPYAAHVLQKFELPTGMRFNDTETLRLNIIEKIKSMKNHIDESEATMDEYSKFTHDNNVFNSNSTGTSPFYVWKYDTIENEVRRLLNGAEILIKADISKGLDYNSVKFNDIGINFKLKNKTLQNSFTSVLQNYALTMTMVGNNYYRCGERYYFISFDDDITISYTLNQDKTENWINPNVVYSIIRGSHTFLSPYGLWSIKLRNVNKSVPFKKLSVFANESIDLELIGRGYYIEQDSDFNFNICNEYLGTFYTVENIVKELS